MDIDTVIAIESKKHLKDACNQSRQIGTCWFLTLVCCLQFLNSALLFHRSNASSAFNVPTSKLRRIHILYSITEDQ